MCFGSGGAHTAAVTQEGEVWTWGNNQYGQVCHSFIVASGSSVSEVARMRSWVWEMRLTAACPLAFIYRRLRVQLLSGCRIHCV